MRRIPTDKEFDAIKYSDGISQKIARVTLLPVETNIGDFDDDAIWVRPDLATEVDAETLFSGAIAPKVSTLGKWLGALCYSDGVLVGFMKEGDR